MNRSARMAAGLVAPLLLFAVPASAGAAGSAGNPTAPANLAMAVPGGSQNLPAGSWINRTRIELRFQVQSGATPVTPQVEVQPSSVPFTGQPNVTGSQLPAGGVTSVTVSGLAGGRTYHWQARVLDNGGGPSAWTPFSAASSASHDFGVDLGSPSRPVISSPSNPNQNAWYNNRVVELQWNSTDGVSGIHGYSYVLERQAHVIAPGAVVSDTLMAIPNLADGVWFVAVRSVDRAGNWSPTATFRLQLDRQAPRLSMIGPSRVTFNPYKGPVTAHFRSNKDAVVRLGLYRVGATKPAANFAYTVRAGQTFSVAWSGMDSHKNAVPKGYYFFSATASDRATNVARVNLGGFSVDPERSFRTASGVEIYPTDGKTIIVWLRAEELYAYDGAKVVMQTAVTTGNPSLPTPPGNYTITAKYHPFEFVSPWPAGSPFWYAPSWVQYAMLFREGGYFLHDAPWRTAFGPGTNGPGQPGTNFGGTHGCVNIPPGPTFFLWNWAPIGTRVIVVP